MLKIYPQYSRFSPLEEVKDILQGNGWNYKFPNHLLPYVKYLQRINYKP